MIDHQYSSNIHIYFLYIKNRFNIFFKYPFSENILNMYVCVFKIGFIVTETISYCNKTRYDVEVAEIS